MASKPCYFLAPTRTCPPEGPIRLSGIISSPSLPDEPINTSTPPLESCSIFTHNQRNWTSWNAKSKSGRIGVWGSFLQSILGAGGDLGNMRTNWFVPSQEYIELAIWEESVRRYIIANKFRERLFMITGVMIASGASGVSKVIQDQGFYTHAGVDATLFSGVPLGAGPEYECHRTARTEAEFGDVDDFVFAFRLRQIKVKKTGEVKHAQYNKDALFDLERFKDKYEKTAKDDGLVEMEIEGFAESDATGDDFGLDGEEVIDEDTGEKCLCVIPED
ncbi:uncharacterized protein BDZ99DRAFT_514413 [Mytilinidion resinicola]|uniref:Uncharacterized protein n=1 Tax=Mytilinidion resinicola TaxID=574789 RepID=A0A6A6Z4L5_9PEZI|nr:uncharacterized protein BDZ99DRAFT_514413 [Mytilinidion resinicola]KAF2815768.1 hypothetical protein BDZ99DRAFT_514413 [Mytilinidion resinicola]